jgi:hypothetical protein
MADGLLSFRSSRVIDANVGFDGADPFADVTADRAVYISNDGLRQDDHLLNVGHKRPKLKPSKLNDRLANWVPMDDTGIDDDPNVLDDMDKISGTGKRKRYESSVRVLVLQPVFGLHRHRTIPWPSGGGRSNFFSTRPCVARD